MLLPIGELPDVIGVRGYPHRHFVALLPNGEVSPAFKQ